MPSGILDFETFLPQTDYSYVQHQNRRRRRSQQVRTSPTSTTSTKSRRPVCRPSRQTDFLRTRLTFFRARWRSAAPRPSRPSTRCTTASRRRRTSTTRAPKITGSVHLAAKASARRRRETRTRFRSSTAAWRRPSRPGISGRRPTRNENRSLRPDCCRLMMR